MSPALTARLARRAPRRAAVVGLVAAVAVIVAGCSPSKPSSSSDTVGRQTTLSGSKGYTCTDPKSDIAVGRSGAPNQAQPAGIDITEASAKSEGQNLVVKFTTVGPIASVPDPLFAVDQGDPGVAPETSFELRAELPAGSPSWTLNLHTFKGGHEATTALSVPVTVSGNTLSYEVPLSMIPPPVSLVWQFGATSTAGDGTVSFDGCSSFTASGSTTTTR